MAEKKVVRFSVDINAGSGYQKHRSTTFDGGLDRFSADIHRKSFERRARERTSLDGGEGGGFDALPKQAKLTPLEFFSLTFRSLGVIFGDIGTSPLYVLKSVFDVIGASHPSHQDVIGSISLIFWTLFLSVTIKYVLFVLSGDNNGEGGTFALLSLIIGKKSSIRRKYKIYYIILALIGSAFVIGDGAITPAISILSAIEGLRTGVSGVDSAILPITVVVIFLLFLAQRFGTAKVGVSFAPIMTLWFFSLAGMGIWRVTQQPQIFVAFNPWEGIQFLVRNKLQGFFTLGSIFLCVTGVEALFADLGHFRTGPVRVAWLCVVFPSVVLNYFGQGALLLQSPEARIDPFFHTVHPSLFWPILILSTMATVIASQAMITGCFSLISQAVSLGYFPPGITVVHTSAHIYGQVYIPEINWLLMILALIVTLGFRTSEVISKAYGVTVSTDMLLTTIFFTSMLHFTWKWHPVKWVPFVVFYLCFDLLFLSSNLTKIPQGGWISLVFAFIFAMLMLSWFIGQRKLHNWISQNMHQMTLDEVKADLDDEKASFGAAFRPTSKEPHQNHEAIDLYQLQDTLGEGGKAMQGKITRTGGVGVFLGPSAKKVPRVFLALLQKTRTMPQTVIFLRFQILHVPFVSIDNRIEFVDHGDGFYWVTAKYGYSEVANCEDAITLAQREGLPLVDGQPINFYLHRERVVVEHGNVLQRIPLWVYSFLKTTLSDTQKFVLPMNSVIEIGLKASL